jgi:hypothetical protein
MTYDEVLVDGVVVAITIRCTCEASHPDECSCRNADWYVRYGPLPEADDD